METGMNYPVQQPSERTRVIVIGASAGAVEALNSILPSLPPQYPVPVLMVVHCRPDRENALVGIFSSRCRVKVKEAEDKEPALSGTVYFAPPNYHLLLERNGSLSLSSDAPVLFSRPSIDVLFESAADAFGDAVLGVVLTGANRDGSKGLNAICSAGGTGIVQKPETAHCPPMPSAALESCPEATPMSLNEISSFLKNLRGKVQHDR